MERTRTRPFVRGLIGTLATTIYMVPSVGLAFGFGTSSLSLSYAMPAPERTTEPPATSLSYMTSIPVAPEPVEEPAWTYQAEPSEALETALDWTLDVSGEAGTQVQADTKLVVTGSDPLAPLIVDATPRAFSSWDAFFAHAQSQLGATPVRDDAGEIIGVTGRVARSGNVVFDDAGVEFESLDYVASVLGGLSGRFEVAGETIELAPTSANPTNVAYFLEQTQPDCDGDNCIEGHTWLTHSLLYHSAGSRTKQISGGTTPVRSSACDKGEPVIHEGVPMCRLIDQDFWEYNHQTGDLEPADEWDGVSGPYIYVPRVTEWHDVLRNELSVNAKAIYNPVSWVDVEPMIENNVREVEVSEWAIFRDVLNDALGNPIPIRSINGMCGYHGSRVYPSPFDEGSNAFAMTSDGATGDDDVLCTGDDPLGLSLESVDFIAGDALTGF